MKRRTVLIGIAALAIAGALGWRYGPGLMSPGPPAVHAAAAVPVTAGVAEAQDIPVYNQGLGTVQAFNTVNVRSRVDGQITKVFFKEGQDVKTGDPLFQIDPRPFQAALDQAKANKAKDQASLQGAQLDLQRYSKLLPSGFQTQQQYDQQKATVGQFQGAVQADQAQIDTTQLNLDYATVRSPIDGRTGQRLIDIGNYVQGTQNTNLVTVTQLKPVYVSFTLPQTELDPVRQANQNGELAVDAYGQDNKTLLSQGKLTLIDNQVDVATGTFHLRATFDNNDLRLWPGEFVNARLVLSTKKNAVTVPAETVMQGPDGAYVYVIKPDDTAERRAVTVAMTQEGRAVIGKGLAAGEHVVVEGQYRVTQGGKLQIRGGPGSNTDNVAQGSTQTTNQVAGSASEPTQ
ncbi:MAG: efflux RND transporter periplasmic adaptor subunit [Xanthobacteraceae bacterium]|nr:efflux RND transporter periplasmic adaptor subunit [Xanthobacteraceae bacterium]